MIDLDKRVYSDVFLSKIKKHLNNSEKNITYPKFIFLCGKAYNRDIDKDKKMYYSTNRGLIDKFLHSKSNNTFIVLSEELWEDGFNSKIDLLTFEEFLAEVSDCIILFVESPGTFSELGTFAYADRLFADKLIVVVDEKYENDKSFIITGPVAKAKKDKAVVLYASVEDGAVMACRELRQVIEKKIIDYSSKTAIVNKRKPNVDGEGVSLSAFIIELLELIYILQPVNRKDLLDIYKIIKGFDSFKFIKKDGSAFHDEIKYDYVLKLLSSVNLITIKDGMIESEHYNMHGDLFIKYGKKLRNKERNKLLNRKYRYKEI